MRGGGGFARLFRQRRGISVNWVFFLLVASAVGLAAWSELRHGGGAMAALAEATLKAA